MTREQIRTQVLEQLAAVAPDADVAHLALDADLREALDLDSLDFLRFVGALHKATGVSIPETDYRSVCTLSGCVDYLVARSPSP